MTDPSGEVVSPLATIDIAGFAAGAVYDAYQQTDGFTDFCQYDLLQILAAGVGGAAAASLTAIMLVSGVGMVGMGLQGVALGLYGIGASASAATLLFIAGTTTVSWAGMALTWLFKKIIVDIPPIRFRSISTTTEKIPQIKSGSIDGPTSGNPFPQDIRANAFEENPQKICVYCRRSNVATQVDHAIPKKLGGNATIENAQLACPHCNQSKGDRVFPKTPPEDYLGPWPPNWWENN